jgi:2-aminoadipate transaminase
MKECFSDDITFTAPEGGMFIWATLPDGKDVNEFCKRAIEEYKIAVVPGNAFAINDEKSHSFRLNFSTPSDEDIIKGIEILGKLTKSI